MMRDAYRTSPAVVQIRDTISVDTFSRSVIDKQYVAAALLVDRCLLTRSPAAESV